MLIASHSFSRYKTAWKRRHPRIQAAPLKITIWHELCWWVPVRRFIHLCVVCWKLKVRFINPITCVVWRREEEAISNGLHVGVDPVRDCAAARISGTSSLALLDPNRLINRDGEPSIVW